MRPGGVVAFVTSRYTMDAQNPSVRKYLAQRADLLGAIRLPKLIRPLEEYTLPRREYVSEMAELPAAKGFITEDEINEHLTGGSNFSGSKSRIYAFYQTPHTAKEKLDFLKNEYGIGGGNNALSRNSMSHVWTDGKGIRYDKPNCTRMELPWTKVVKYYDHHLENH